MCRMSCFCRCHFIFFIQPLQRGQGDIGNRPVAEFESACACLSSRQIAQDKDQHITSHAECSQGARPATPSQNLQRCVFFCPGLLRLMHCNRVSQSRHVQVYECMVRGIAVMRRRGDSFVNATQILKVAGVDKGRRTKILEKEILPGKHEIVQGGYGKYQGTWCVSIAFNSQCSLSVIVSSTVGFLSSVDAISPYSMA
jgi:hypothetical protein